MTGNFNITYKVIKLCLLKVANRMCVQDPFLHMLSHFIYDVLSFQSSDDDGRLKKRNKKVMFTSAVGYWLLQLVITEEDEGNT